VVAPFAHPDSVSTSAAFSYAKPLSFFSASDDGINWFAAPGIRETSIFPHVDTQKVLLTRVRLRACLPELMRDVNLFVFAAHTCVFAANVRVLDVKLCVVAIKFYVFAVKLCVF
jgi:hypothetical protein